MEHAQTIPVIVAFTIIAAKNAIMAFVTMCLLATQIIAQTGKVEVVMYAKQMLMVTWHVYRTQLALNVTQIVRVAPEVNALVNLIEPRLVINV